MAKSGPMTAPDGCTYWFDGHLCDRAANHCDQCMCRCAHRWTREQAGNPRGLTLHLSGLGIEDELVAWLRRQIDEGGISA